MTMLDPSSESAIAVIVCETDIDQPIESAWISIGCFADAGQFLNISSKLVSGDGALGSIRLVGDSILELLVAIGPYCYGYAQIQGPMASLAYHGCLSLQHLSSNRCKLIYTILYDESTMDDQRRTGEEKRIRDRFNDAVNAMKHVAETTRHTDA